MKKTTNLFAKAIPATVAAGVAGAAAARTRKINLCNPVRRLDENIYVMDYRTDYDIDGLLASGVSNLGELIAFTAKTAHKAVSDFTIGTDLGGGCTTFSAVTPEGAPTLGRNFDFKESPCFVVWTHPKNHYASLSVVDNNFLAFGGKLHTYGRSFAAQTLLAPYCCVDGINEKGLAIAVLQIRAKAAFQNDPSKKDITTTAMIRAVLDTCADVDEAVALLRSYNMHDSLFTLYHYQIVDASGRSVVAEYIDNELAVYEKGSDKYPIDGSVYENDGLAQQYVCNFTIKKEIGDFEAEQHGEDRIEAVTRVLKEKNGVLTELESMDLLSHVRLNYDHPKYPWRVVALWSAVYNTKDRTVRLAANMNYSKIYTFAVDKPTQVLATEKIEQSAYPETEWQYL